MNYKNYSDEVIKNFFENNYVKMTHYVGENRKGYKEYDVIIDIVNSCVAYSHSYCNKIKLEVYDDSDMLNISLTTYNFYDMDCNESFISLNSDFKLVDIRHRYEFNDYSKEDRREMLLDFKKLINSLERNLLKTKLELEMKNDNNNKEIRGKI